MFIIIVGTIVDGMTFVGPFDNNESALSFAEDVLNSVGSDWNIVRLTPDDEL